jgi:hypothetical protein
MTTGPVCPINFGFTFSATPFYLLLVRSHYMLSVNITIETEANGAVCSWGGIINYAKIDIFWARALIVAVAICGFFHLVGIGALILHWEFWNSHLPPPSLNNATLPMSGYRGDPKSGDGTVGFAFDIFGFCFSLVVVVGSSLAMSILNVQDTKAYLEHSSRRIEESKGLKLDL